MSEQGRQHNQKLKAFLIYQFLLENSDANHCFSAGDIADFLINDIGVKKFICSHAKQNPISGIVMQKVGFKHVKDAYFEKFDKTQKFDCKVYYLDI